MHPNRLSKKEAELDILRVKIPMHTRSLVRPENNPSPPKRSLRSKFALQRNMKTCPRPRSVSELQRRLEYLEKKMESISLGDSSTSLVSEQQNYRRQENKNESLDRFHSKQKNKAMSQSPSKYSFRKNHREAEKHEKPQNIRSSQKQKRKRIKLDKENQNHKRKTRRKKVTKRQKSSIASKLRESYFLKNLKRDAFLILENLRKSQSKHERKRFSEFNEAFLLKHKPEHKEKDLRNYRILKRKLKLFEGSHLRRIKTMRKVEPVIVHKSCGDLQKRPAII